MLDHKEAAEEEIFDGISINVVANKNLEEKAPEAYEFLSNWNISIDDMEKIIATIDDGEAPEDVAQEWIDNHEDEVEEIKNGN